MTVTEVGQLLGNVVQTYMGLADSRVVLKDENFDAPKDQGIYILVEYESSDIVGISQSVDPDTGLETMGQSVFMHFAVEVCSRGRDAQDRWQEALFALFAVSGQQAAETSQCSFFRSTPPMDLSSIEGAGALRRYRIPVIVSTVQTKTGSAAVPQIDKFPADVSKVEA